MGKAAQHLLGDCKLFKHTLQYIPDMVKFNKYLSKLDLMIQFCLIVYATTSDLE